MALPAALAPDPRIPEDAGSAAYARALLNVLEDLVEEKSELENLKRAILNVLEDSNVEEGRLNVLQTAMLNIFDDAEADKIMLAATEHAVINILSDSEEGNRDLTATQKAILNILEDSEADKRGLSLTQRGLLNILDDIDTERNERAKAEEQIRVLNNALEIRVRERTAALTLANQELESFAYSVSHDLRAPLRAIDGFSQILLEDYQDKLDDAGRDALGRVRSATQRMGNLIDDMLALSRSTRGVVDARRVDLSEIAEAVIATLKESEPSRRVDIMIAPSVVGRGDERLLRTVLENLLSNAWKFTAHTPNAAIEFSGEFKQHELVCRIRDNGVGFDMAFAHNLFLPFQRLHRRSEFPGNGIGLATVKRIISRLGGTVWAEAAVNCGATFYFTIPRANS